MGRGHDEAHTTVDQGQGRLPLIAMDYCCLKGTQPDGEPQEYGTTLVMADYDTKMVRPLPKPSKEADAYTVTAVVKFINSLFHRRVRLRPDNEPSLIAICEKVKEKIPGQVVLETTPRFSSSSNPAESAVKIVEEQFRTSRGDLEAAYGATLTPSHPMWSWLACGAGWSISRFRVNPSGTTSYEDTFGHPCNHEVVPVGETVMARIARPSNNRQVAGRPIHKGGVGWVKGHLVWAPRGER